MRCRVPGHIGGCSWASARATRKPGQRRAQFVGDVGQQALLRLDAFLQLARHGVEVPGQLVGFVATGFAHLKARLEIALGQAAGGSCSAFRRPVSRRDRP